MNLAIRFRGSDSWPSSDTTSASDNISQEENMYILRP